jgi:hypothetical protein
LGIYNDNQKRGINMSVKLIDNKAFYGYRVRRTVGGKLYQEYYSLKENGARMSKAKTKEVELEARKRDGVLEKQQSAAKEARKPEMCFLENGTVKGISFLKKREKSGNMTPIFQVGVASDIESETDKASGKKKKKIVCTSFSINAHGLKGAWEKAVDAYTMHKNIKKGSALYKEISGSMPKVDLSDVESEKKVKPGKKAAAKKVAKVAKPAKKAAKKAAVKKAAKSAKPAKSAKKVKPAKVVKPAKKAKPAKVVKPAKKAAKKVAASKPKAAATKKKGVPKKKK